MVFHLIQYASMALTPDDLKSIHTLLTNALKAQSTELKTYVDSRLETQSKELETHIDIKLQEQNETLDISFREIIEEIYGTASINEEVQQLKKRVNILESKLAHN